MKSTRDRIIELLRVSAPQTVETLSAALGLTRTAVTNQLVTLQAAGLVRRQGLRPGSRRPSVIYELTEAADRLFPKAYEAFASALLEEIKRHRSGDLKGYLHRIADRWVARDLPRLEGSRGRERLERTKEILVERGFMPVLEQTSTGYLLRENNCPVMQLTRAHPEICDMIHRWLEVLFDAKLDRMRCLRRGDPFSAYAVTKPGGRGS